MPWDESRYTLGVVDMDATHREFIDLVDALLGASDEDFPALWNRLHEHVCRHFDSEWTMMQACRFPAIAEHHNEHLRVLGELGYFSRALGAGRIDLARQYAEGLPAWFATHLATMDSALAACLPH